MYQISWCSIVILWIIIGIMQYHTWLHFICNSHSPFSKKSQHGLCPGWGRFPLFFASFHSSIQDLQGFQHASLVLSNGLCDQYAFNKVCAFQLQSYRFQDPEPENRTAIFRCWKTKSKVGIHIFTRLMDSCQIHHNNSWSSYIYVFTWV